MRHFALTPTLFGLLLTASCTPSLSKSSETDKEDAVPNCAEPENPYNEGTGDYAGYQWAEEKSTGACGGSQRRLCGIRAGLQGTLRMLSRYPHHNKSVHANLFDPLGFLNQLQQGRAVNPFRC